jgi:cytidine deaminase
MTTGDLHGREAVLVNFPENARPELRRLSETGGLLEPDSVDRLCALLELRPRELALTLLPLAQTYARPEVSGFHVGAVALAQVQHRRGDEGRDGDRVALILGANLEFGGLPLWHTIHAEQSAVVNAWCHGIRGLLALAVSAPPCGACRQFLLEVVGEADLEILLPHDADGGRSIPLATLLPEPFGPVHLNNGAGPFDTPADQVAAVGSPLSGDGNADPVCEAALKAATQAYAPYSGNLAGCAIALSDGRVVCGRNLESAAFNPGITAVQAALARASLYTARLPADIRRVVLAERATATAQAAASELLLASWAPGAELTIHSV